jgi:hypothetical protein
MEFFTMTTSRAGSTTIGVFATREAADRAVADLKAAGYRDDQIGLVSKDSTGNAGTGAAVGVGVGAAAGAAVGAGVAMGVIPVIGPVLAIGTLGTVLLHAAGGAAAAGIAGALIGWGVPDEDARYYEGEVNAGRYLVTVDSGGRHDHVRGLYSKHGGYDRSTAPKL